ncbi:MAG: ABC-F family ATP-binding cassette domain-containing protein [Candidatus Spechtbacterales bacterium]
MFVERPTRRVGRSNVELIDMLSVKNLSKTILGETLFEEVSFVVAPKEKVGLIGPNGAGKSTLLKIILGTDEADSGVVEVRNERIGYLPQELAFDPDETVASYIESAANPRAVEALERVGMQHVSLNQQASRLSGGQKTRLALAKILLGNPTLLIFDEPTNHLDVRTLAWLDEFIRTFRGSVLLVSHNRALLESAVERIIELDTIDRTLHEYPGNYTIYRELKGQQQDRWEKTYKQQQKHKKKLEELLRQKKQQAHNQSNPKKGKELRAVERRIQREIVDKEIAAPRTYAGARNIGLEGSVHTGKLMARFTGVAKSYQEKSVFREVSFEIRGAEHILLRGENGSGKTTLLKMMLGEVDPTEGEVRVGENVHVGHFSQEHEGLDRQNTVLDELLATPRVDISTQEARAVLAGFLFRGNAVFKRVEALSLGERVRLMFAKLVVQKNEMLVLDEPTNHLDIPSVEAIEHALREYRGAVVVVSHDIYFLEQLGIDKVFTLQNGKLTESLG